tara:strand:+ start:849 stop:1478 length:630 start_codon:yes stop_codon:yes gene_type:complete
MALSHLRAAAAAALSVVLLSAAAAQAAVITQTINFSYENFTDIGGGSAIPPYDPVSGSVTLTYDNATTTSLVGQSVDSISFSTPVAVFPTSGVFFDLRINPDVAAPAFTGYEINIYFDEFAVGAAHPADFLIRIATALTHMPGDDLSTGASSTILYSDDDFFLSFFHSGEDTLSSTIVTEASALPEPATLPLIGLGLVAAGMARRRVVR